MTAIVEGLALNLATVRKQWNLREAVAGCVRHGIGAIAPWRDQIADIGLGEASKLIHGHGLQVTGVCRAGFFPAASQAGLDAAYDDNRRAIDECAELNADCLMLVVGGLPEGSRDLAGAHRMVAEGIARLVPHARDAGVPLAIEPLHPMYTADRACVNTLKHALDICEAIGDDIVGVAIDAYHVWWDPELAEQIARAGRLKRILAHHICDWLVPTRDMLNDRGMMGDGVIDLRGFRAMFEVAGYHGPQEVEIFSVEDWWTWPPDEVLAICIERYRACCLPVSVPT